VIYQIEMKIAIAAPEIAYQPVPRLYEIASGLTCLVSMNQR
jgi:hypothetical protein